MKPFYFPLTPTGPNYDLDWETVVKTYSWLQPLEHCPQNPDYHAEGNVLIHTRLVCESLIGLAQWRQLAPTEQSILFAAALLHDIAKPAATTIEPDGKITAKGHVRQGVKMAMGILWRMGIEVEHRLAIGNLIQYGSLPMWFWDKPNPQKSMIMVSTVSRCDWVALLSEADVRGRWGQDQAAILDRIQFFREYAIELGISNTPWPFTSDQSRFLYFQKETADPNYAAFDDTVCEVTLLSGLPGMGKDTWIKNHCSALPVISLDVIRKQLGAKSTGDQGEVIQRAKEQAKTYLRTQQSFVWNATNLSQQLRSQLIELFTNYHARVNIVYLEVALEIQQQRNRARSAIVPQQVIDRMIDRLEIPQITEAHNVQWILNIDRKTTGVIQS
jgi:putative nucleotidyltransferase with HDIG domain